MPPKAGLSVRAFSTAPIARRPPHYASMPGQNFGTVDFGSGSSSSGSSSGRQSFGFARPAADASQPFIPGMVNPNSQANLEAMLKAMSQKNADQRTKKFHVNKMVNPREFRKENLEAGKRPPRKDPLIGPKEKVARLTDPFFISKSNPLDHYMNPTFVGYFLNEMGQIKTRAQTGLTRKSQRQVARMVKRARGIGILHTFTKEPAKRGLGSSHNYSRQ